MPKPLSERQQSILEFLRDYIRQHRFSPTMREIAHEVGISSTSVVKYNLDILERAGHIERDPEVSRGIRLVRLAATSESELFRAPLLGRITASMPIPIPDNPLLNPASHPAHNVVVMGKVVCVLRDLSE